MELAPFYSLLVKTKTASAIKKVNAEIKPTAKTTFSFHKLSKRIYSIAKDYIYIGNKHIREKVSSKKKSSPQTKHINQPKKTFAGGKINISFTNAKKLFFYVSQEPNTNLPIALCILKN